MKRRVYSKAIAIFIAAVFVITLFPDGAYSIMLSPGSNPSNGQSAEGEPEVLPENMFTGEESGTDYSGVSDEEQDPEEPYIIGEDGTMRSENTKHFVMSDHSRVAAVYSDPVHYEEEYHRLPI